MCAYRRRSASQKCNEFAYTVSRYETAGPGPAVSRLKRVDQVRLFHRRLAEPSPLAELERVPESAGITERLTQPRSPPSARMPVMKRNRHGEQPTSRTAPR